jgi:hypothetical protein
VNEEDLQYELTVEPNMKRFEQALDAQADAVDRAAKRSSETAADQSRAVTKVTKLDQQAAASADVRQAAMEGAVQQLERQRGVLVQMQALMNPAIARQMLDVERQITDAKLRQEVSVSQASLSVNFSQERLRLEDQITEAKHRQAVEQLRVDSDPARLRRRVEMEREIDAMKKRQREAEEKERYKQERPGFFERLVSNPLKTLGQGVSNVRETLPKEGGVGGTVDKLLETFRGGMKEGFANLWNTFKQKPEPTAPTTTTTTTGGTKSLPTQSLRPAGKPSVARPLPEVRAAPKGAPDTGSVAKVQSVTAEAGAAEGAEGAAVAGGAEAAAGAAGPIGLAIVAGLAVAKTGAMALQGVMKGVAKASRVLTGSLSSLEEPLGMLSIPFDKLTGGLTGISDAFDHVVGTIPILGDSLKGLLGPLTQVPDQFKAFTQQLVGFAAKASPATMTLFTHALEDAQAVVGHAFVPVLELMTDVIRLGADALANFLPSADEVRAAMADVKAAFAELRTELGPLMQEFGPFIRQAIVSSIKILGGTMADMARLAGIAAKALAWLFSPLRDISGMLGMDNSLRSSVGAAARNAQFQSADQYREQLQLGAYSQGQGPTQAQMPSMVSQIRDILNRWTTEWSLDRVIARVQNAIRENVPGLPLLPNLNPGNGGGGGGNGGGGGGGAQGFGQAAGALLRNLPRFF